MKIRQLIAGLFLLLELPIILPFAVAAAITGLLYGLQIVAERTAGMLAARKRPLRRDANRAVARAAFN